MELLSVSGTIRFVGGIPAAGFRAIAFDRDLRSEQLLGEARTERDGAYRVDYDTRDFLNRERGTADVVVRAFDDAGNLLAESRIFQNAPRDLGGVDLLISPERCLPPSLFERIAAAVAPLRGEIAVEDLEEDEKHRDLSFLAAETGFDTAVLARFVLAHRMAARGIAAEFWFALLGGGHFAWSGDKSVAESLAAIEPRLLAFNQTAVRKRLGASFGSRDLNEQLRDRTDVWIKAHLDLAARQLLGEGEARCFLGQALDHAGIEDPTKQLAVARLVGPQRILTPDLIKALRSSRALRKEQVADLETSFQLADLTNGEFPLVRLLKDEFEIRSPDRVHVLARQSERDWIALIERAQRSKKVDLPFDPGEVAHMLGFPHAEAYATMLERRFREAFPTAAFAGGLERASANGGVNGIRHAPELGRIIERHPEFDLLHTPIDEFLSGKARSKLGALADDPAFRLELKAVQRVFKVAPTFAATDALLADGIHSAQMVYRLGESEFVRRYAGKTGLSESDARMTWNRAADTHAAVLTIVGDLTEFASGVLPGVLNSAHPDLSKFPNWENLFQSGDMCHCEHCRSVLSPAAYFTDLLMFLRDRRSNKPKLGGGFYSAKDILFERRPDLGYLELNCENALTTLPYVDLVCEVLERAVDADGANDLVLTGFAAMPATGRETAVVAAFAAAFADTANDGKTCIALGDDFTLSQVDPADPDRWVVHGEDATYLLKKKSGADFYAELIPNTKASAEELRAYPAYVNPKAYERLSQPPFPWVLPFSLFAEEVRAAFRKSGLERWKLMQALRSAAAPNNPTEVQIAAEYFGINVDETGLICIADPLVATQQKIWDEIGNSGWLAVRSYPPSAPPSVANVKTFLAKTGLDYGEMLALFDLKFINPARDIDIQHFDPSCDTDKKAIQGLDLLKLDRIHRFLRLWRKLGTWKMWELDLVIDCPGIGKGALDEACLVNLCQFDRLRSRLGRKASVEALCGLFGHLGVESRFVGPDVKRGDGYYASLFLNRKLVQPIDDALGIAKVTSPTAEKISGHRPAILAALGVSEAELDILAGLTRPSTGLPYIDDGLSLSNLSFLWRHAWLARQLKVKTEDWRTLLRLFQQDYAEFSDPKAALDLVEQIDRLRAAEFTPDELAWLLAADRTVKAAIKETDAARFLTGLRGELQAITAEYDPSQYPFLALPSDPEQLTLLLATLLPQLNRDEAAAQDFIAILRDELVQEVKVAGLPAGFVFPAAITATPNHIRIDCDSGKGVIRFTGLMTSAQQTTLLTDLALGPLLTNASYKEAIDQMFEAPRLALKFLDPIFAAPLTGLPAAVDFKSLPDAALAARMTYDSEARELRVVGILSKDDTEALDNLSAPTDLAYRNAVQVLFTTPRTYPFLADALWLKESDLKFPLRDPTVTPGNPGKEDFTNLNANLAEAAKRALSWLSRTLSERSVVRALSGQLGITEALTRRLVTDYAPLPETVLEVLTGPFAGSQGVIDYAAAKKPLDSYFWAARVGTLWKKWSLTLTEQAQLRDLAATAQLLDFGNIPPDSTAPVAPIDRLIRTARLVAFREHLPESRMTLLDLLTKLSAGAYVAPDYSDFAADVALINESWTAGDVAAMVGALDLAFPASYLLVESWERIARVFGFVSALNAGVETVGSFATAAMQATHAGTLKGLLRARFGNEAWLGLAAEIQDSLRERKRDALAAYLLAQPMPKDAPSGKWQNPNDLYAYYLLDCEMCACALTSRLVQASGSVQLFVQRAHLGLEYQITVQAAGADGDSAWRWWPWMRKYRLWEANRKVFCWTENFCEPELRADRSPFFKDLEDELLQSEIDTYSVEAAFAGYLEKLDAVSQLEIAGFYQEDRADDAILHLFGRSKGAEPHEYYYRRFDYRQWTPWEKVDLDIPGNYLIPAVVAERLHLFWPVLSEVQDDSRNKSAKMPTGSNPDLPETWKRFELRLAVSDYRRNRWTPKRTSKDSTFSLPYKEEVVPNEYISIAVDATGFEDRFYIRFDGNSSTPLPPTVHAEFQQVGFTVSGCRGVPERIDDNLVFASALTFDWGEVLEHPRNQKWVERAPRAVPTDDDLTVHSHNTADPSAGMVSVDILEATPGRFRIAPPWHLSYFDTLTFNGILITRAERLQPTFGTWLPFFYNDRNRTFFVQPVVRQRPLRGAILDTGGEIIFHYPAIKGVARAIEQHFEGIVQAWVNSLNISALSAPVRQAIETILHQNFPELRFPDESPPPYSDRKIAELTDRFIMRFVRFGLGALSSTWFQQCAFEFRNFYHPFVCDFAKLVHNPLKGIPSLMSRETQLRDSGFSFDETYGPTGAVIKAPTKPTQVDSYPDEVVDFDPDGAYAGYNWELFFHVPLLIADALSRNQRFEEARNWYHYIFNPIGVESAMPGGSPVSKYWITKPFFNTTNPQYLQQRIENILRLLAGDTSAPGYSVQARQALEEQVRDWRTHPYDPHRIATYRTVAYQKSVVMKYCDNLIAWGDFLFRQDSLESINEATQIYVLAAEILGPKPRMIPPQAKPPVESYNELELQLDAFGNALVQVENLVPPMPGTTPSGANPAPLPTLYFCIPHNEKLLGYWDVVADRLYKIRHCQNIDGVQRQLALFEPPIDPALLVKAAAAGLDIASALAEINAPLPPYRFNILLQKANEVCGDLTALGAALLTALEKKDAEALALLRQGHEIHLLQAVTAVRQLQIDEASANLESLQRSRATVEERRKYYAEIEKLSDWEEASMITHGLGIVSEIVATVLNATSGTAALVPSFTVGMAGFGGSPVFTVTQGGPPIAQSAFSWGTFFSGLGGILHSGANLMSTQAGNERRWEEWKLQERLADRELAQIDKSIAAADLRVGIAQAEFANHLKQIDDAKAVDTFMRSKYTNQELYQWQIGQISSVYFQTYRLAHDLARRCERSFRFELGLQDSNFIGFAYWDSLKKGLQSGERLRLDLRRLESAWLEQNRREFELTKQVSLLQLDPLALVRLRATGRCFFRLPEEIFDLDFPGHYFRRIKSVSLTLPCVAGPHTTIAGTLRLLKNSIRTSAATGAGGADYPRNTDDSGLPVDDSRFVESNIPVKAVATSSGQNDSGLFELNFRDDRYLPFEGAGCISDWSLELFGDPASDDFAAPLRQFDYRTLADAMLHIKYTAREDAGPLRHAAADHLRTYLTDDSSPTTVVLDLRQAFRAEWDRFLDPVNPASGNLLEFDLTPALIRTRDAGKTLTVTSAHLFARCMDPGVYIATLIPPVPTAPVSLSLNADKAYGGLHQANKKIAVDLTPTDTATRWSIRLKAPSGGNLAVDPPEIENAVLILNYHWQ